MIKKSNKNKGFTLIETLVAITVLMIAIAGPLTIANKALTAALDAKNVMIASNLAQESMEYVKNVKDNLIEANGNSGRGDYWLMIGSTDLKWCTSWNPCAISAIAASANICWYGSGCQLFLDANNNYVYGSGTPTPFTRKFYLASGPALEGSTGYSDALAVVVVSWNTGSVSDQITLQSLISSAPR